MAYNENDPRGSEYLHALGKKVYVEPTSFESRTNLVEYLNYHSEWAQSLSESELRNGVGGTIASNILGALSWQAIGNTDGVSWINEKDEPELYEALNLASTLDNISNNPDAWSRLLEILKKVK